MVALTEAAVTGSSLASLSVKTLYNPSEERVTFLAPANILYSSFTRGGYIYMYIYTVCIVYQCTVHIYCIYIIYHRDGAEMNLATVTRDGYFLSYLPVLLSLCFCF